MSFILKTKAEESGAVMGAMSYPRSKLFEDNYWVRN